MKAIKELEKFFFGSGLGIILIVVIYALAGMFIFWLSSLATGHLGDGSVLAKVLGQTGNLLLTVGGLSVILRTKIWMDAIHSVMDKLTIKEAVLKSGIIDFWPYDQVPWNDLFGQARSITVVAISARPLFVDRITVIKDFLLKSQEHKLTVILPNPEDDELMQIFDKEFGEKVGTRKQKTMESIQELLKVIEKNSIKERVEVRVSSRRVTYSCYQFDDRFLYVPYLAEPTRDSSRIPAFLFRAGHIGSLYLGQDVGYLERTSKSFSSAT